MRGLGVHDTLINAVETNRFKLEELFFSRTDTRGVIQSANEVFRHVSHMQWEDLIGAPHKVIRHPLMPRAVFRLMWSAIQAGEPIGAYVVNLAEDKTCYWVFAVVLPIEGGYLSVRLKPTSERLAQIKTLYAQLRAAEDSGDQSIEDSEAALLAALKEEGHADYEAFMTAALTDEMTQRAVRLSHGRIPKLDALQDIQAAVDLVAADALTVSDLFERTRQIPFNMRLQAVKMEGREGPISVISSNHQTMTETLAAQVQKLREAAELGARPLQETQFVTGTSLLMEQVTHQFDREATLDADRRQADESALDALRRQFEDQAQAAVANTAHQATALSNLCKTFRRSLSALEMTRIMCDIEQAKFQGDASGLNNIAAHLLAIEKNLSEVIGRIETSVSQILDATLRLDKSTKQAA